MDTLRSTRKERLRKTRDGARGKAENGRYWTRNATEIGLETSNSSMSGAESGALKNDAATLADPDLAGLVTAWSHLSTDEKWRILEFVASSTSSGTH